MPPKKPRPAATDDAAETFMRNLEHPLKPTIEALRGVVRGVSPEVREGVRWNAPSFATTDHFATFNLRTTDRVRLILHTGAKPKAAAKAGLGIPDPAGLLEWLAPDRALVTVRDLDDLAAQRAPLEAILLAWIAAMRGL